MFALEQARATRKWTRKQAGACSAIKVGQFCSLRSLIRLARPPWRGRQRHASLISLGSAFKKNYQSGSANLVRANSDAEGGGVRGLRCLGSLASRGRADKRARKNTTYPIGFLHILYVQNPFSSLLIWNQENPIVCNDYVCVDAQNRSRLLL